MQMFRFGRRLELRAPAVLVALMLSACAHDVTANYPSTALGADLGSITVRFTSAVPNATITVNDVLVAEGEHTSKVIVQGVPAGPARVVIAAGGGSQSRLAQTHDVIVYPHVDTAVVVAGTEMSTAAAIYQGLYTLGSWIFLGAVYAALL